MAAVPRTVRLCISLGDIFPWRSSPSRLTLSWFIARRPSLRTDEEARAQRAADMKAAQDLPANVKNVSESAVVAKAFLHHEGLRY